MTRFRLRSFAFSALVLTAAGCGNEHEGGGELHAGQVVLRREVQGTLTARIAIDHLGIEKAAGLLDRGFNVRLPTERIKPLAVPVGIHPTMEVRGQRVALAITVTDLAITKHVIWLGSEVSVALGRGGTARLNAATPSKD